MNFPYKQASRDGSEVAVPEAQEGRRHNGR